MSGAALTTKELAPTVCLSVCPLIAHSRTNPGQCAWWGDSDKCLGFQFWLKSLVRKRLI